MHTATNIMAKSRTWDEAIVLDITDEMLVCNHRVTVTERDGKAIKLKKQL